MRIASKLRRAVTASTAARKLRQAALTNYERKFRSMILKCKTIAALLEKVRLTSTQHMKVYAALTESIVVWKEHPQEVKKPKRKRSLTPKRSKTPKKTKQKNTKKNSQAPEDETTEPPPAAPVEVPATEYDQVSTLVTDTVASYNADYKAQVQTPLTEWQKQVTTVLRTMVSKTYQARDHLDHYELKLVTVQKQHTKLAANASSTPAALEQATVKVERNQTKLSAAQTAYDDCMVGLEQCSRIIDLAAADIWPLVQKVLSLEQSYTGSQLVTVQGRLTTLVDDLHAVASDREPAPSLQEILTHTLSKVEQPMLAGTSSVRNAAAPEVKSNTASRSVEPSAATAAVAINSSADTTPPKIHGSAAAAPVVVANNNTKKQVVDADTMDASNNHKDESSPRGVAEAVEETPAAGVEDASFLLSSTLDTDSRDVVVENDEELSKKDSTTTPLDVAVVQEVVAAQLSAESEANSMYALADDDKDAAPATHEVRKLSEETIPTSNTKEEEEVPANAPADEVSADKVSTPLKHLVPQKSDGLEEEKMLEI